MEYVIETNNLVKQYKTKLAVNDISIHVRRGDIYGLIGKNGAGKTTLMKLILGLSAPTKGDIMLFGNGNLSSGRSKIGSLIEAPGFYKNCTAYENLLRFSMLYGADPKEIKPLLEKVGLGNTGSKKAGDFSLGMRQRLGIAVALLAKPEVLVLDEPINGLDPAGIKEIRDIIISLNKEGVTFIISSHLLDELAKIVTNYGIIADGRLAEEVSAKTLEERCRKYVKIVASDNEETLRKLKTRYPDIKAKLEDNCVTLSSHIESTAEINSYLISNKIAVAEISICESDLEDYFIERLGR